MAQWDPATYGQFADERSRPFADLLSRVRAERPGTVVDLGCGTGALTATLGRRWPGADVLGIDSSPVMVSEAAAYATDRVRFAVADLRDWRPERPVDVLVSNAALQWVPDHRERLPHLVGSLGPGGWLAFQVPGNFDAPSHRLLAELADRPPYADFTSDRERPGSAEPGDYLSDLTALGCHVDAWETTYLHVLPGEDAVFRWIAGTGARPVLQALPEQLRSEFEREYRARLRRAYPARAYGTLLPFRRLFVVARARPR